MVILATRQRSGVMAGYDLDLVGGVRGKIRRPAGSRDGIPCQILGVTNIRRWDGDLATFPSQMRSERGKAQPHNTGQNQSLRSIGRVVQWRPVRIYNRESSLQVGGLFSPYKPPGWACRKSYGGKMLNSLDFQSIADESDGLGHSHIAEGCTSCRFLSFGGTRFF
jgi:hypothetical protein